MSTCYDFDSSLECIESENESENEEIDLPSEGSVIPSDEYMQYFEGLDEEEMIKMMKHFINYYDFLPPDLYGDYPYGWETSYILGTTSNDVLAPFVQSWNDYVLENGESVEDTLRISKVDGISWCAEFGCDEEKVRVEDLLNEEINELLKLVRDVGFNPPMI